MSQPFNLHYPTPRRSIFVSYHHGVDLPYYEELSNVFGSIYGVVRDNSVDRLIDSVNPDYVIRAIRENFIVGTSCTLVLCGPQTPWRKYVDWEIKATLDKGHGLIGIGLPNNPSDSSGKVTIPNRLYDNIQSGFAIWVGWGQIVNDPGSLASHIELANAKSPSLIQNRRQLRTRNG